MKRLYIIKLGQTFAHLSDRIGDFEHWIAERLGVVASRLEVVNAPAGEALPAPDAPAGVVLTGSHCMVTERRDWSVRTGQWLGELVRADVPTLAICYGHQLLADQLGGRAAINPAGLEFGTQRLALTHAACEDQLFSGLPEAFLANVCHSESAVKLPPSAVRLAFSEMDANHAFRIGRRVWGVQFHPEFGGEAIREYIILFAERLTEQGVDVEALLATVRPTPEAAGLLHRFGELVGV